jgi:hypothetical protein
MTTKSNFLHESIADIPESELVVRVLGDQHWRSSLFAIRGIPYNCRLLPRVPLAGLPGNIRGDVDVLLLPPLHPEQSIAVEVKRIKVGLEAIRTKRPNKMHEFKKGVRQANLLAELGFSQVYLWVLVMVDTREQNAGRYTYEGLHSELRSKIGELFSTAGLDQRVGLVHYEFVQPMDFAPLSIGTHGGNLIRLAQEVDQPPHLTAWVDQLDRTT